MKKTRTFKGLKPIPAQFDYALWLSITRRNLQKRFPKVASLLIEEAVDLAFEQISDAATDLSFTLSSLQNISKFRLIDLRKKACHRLTDSLDMPAESSTPLSISLFFKEKDAFSEQENDWNRVIHAVSQIPNTRRRALLETYFRAKTGYVEPEKYSMKQLQAVFNMPSEQSVRAEIHRGLTDLRGMLVTQ
jgi:hypothetical protein